MSIDSMVLRVGTICQAQDEEKEKLTELLYYNAKSKRTQYQTVDRLKERQRRQEKTQQEYC